MHRAAGREMLGVAPGGEVDRDHVGDQRDVRMLRRGGFERLADGIAGGVGDMDDAAVAVPAFAGQVQRAILAGEGTPSSISRRDGARRFLDDMLDHARGR